MELEEGTRDMLDISQALPANAVSEKTPKGLLLGHEYLNRGSVGRRICFVCCEVLLVFRVKIPLECNLHLKSNISVKNIVYFTQKSLRY